MKTMRKFFTVLLALAMTLALAVSAFAADTGSITITNPQGDHTYTAHKIFDVTYTADGVNYSYTISDTDAAFSTVKAYADVTANGLSLTAVANTNKYNVSIGAGFSAASFAQHLKTNVDSLGTGTAFTKVDNTMKASGLALGYYFVSGTSGAVCELATAKDIQIRDKNEVPQIEKSVDDNDGTVEIGQKLTYTITGKVPSTKGYSEFTYQVTDTMTEGLTFNKDVKVTIGGTDVTAAATITNNGNGFVASVNMMDYQDQIEEHTPTVASTLEISEKALAALDQGMRMTGSIGTAEQYLKDYPIAIACKTGTAQWQGTTSTGSFSGSDHASFVLYAPADDPEIAIAVYIERGSQGGNLANVCIPILDAYFSSSAKYETIATENIAY